VQVPRAGTRVEFPRGTGPKVSYANLLRTTPVNAGTQMYHRVSDRRRRTRAYEPWMPIRRGVRNETYNHADTASMPRGDQPSMRRDRQVGGIPPVVADVVTHSAQDTLIVLWGPR